MSAKILDGKQISIQLLEKLKKNIAQAQEQLNQRFPCIAVILVGEDPASQIYVRNKQLACKKVGIESRLYQLPDTTTEKELLDLVIKLNECDKTDGILVQLPLPAHIDDNIVIDNINDLKDVDGFHPYNMGLLAQRRIGLRPCTPQGIIYLLKQINFNFKQSDATIVGASNIVGRPLGLELLLAGCTVTTCHRFTKDLSKHVQSADLLVSAVGKRDIIDPDWIKPGAVVIDVGLNRNADGKLCGDLDFEAAKTRASWITPVPGGVGPMTVAMLMTNTFQAYLKLHE